jgi:hypothetical protein
MIELILYIWLLGATLVFVGVAMTGEASDRFEPLWLLGLAACWPVIVLAFLAGAAVTLASRIISTGR